MTANDGENFPAEEDHQKINDELERVVNSAEFQVPERSRNFLKYVVQETLEGRSEQLNAVSIAQAVFGRGPAFDAQSDPIVRIEAGRIRRALERYYLVSGSESIVRIKIPKGHYIPRFEQRGYGSEPAGVFSGASPLERRPTQNEGKIRYRDLLVPVGIPAIFGVLALLALIRPLERYLDPRRIPATSSQPRQETTIIVEPLIVLGRAPDGATFAQGLSDHLSARLARIDGIAVLAPSAAQAPATPEFNLQGNVALEQDSLHVRVRLIRCSDGSVVWAKPFDYQTQGRSLLDLQDEIGKEIAEDLSTIAEKTTGHVTR